MITRRQTIDEKVVDFNLSIDDSNQSDNQISATTVHKLPAIIEQMDKKSSTPSQSDMFKLLVDIKKSVDNLNKFENTVSNKIAIHDKDLKTVNIRVSTNTNDIASIKRRLDSMDSNHSAQLDLVHSLELQKQAQLRNNISIMGISPDKDENLIEIVLSLCENIGVSCNSNYIASVKRINQSKSHIIVTKFSSPQIKDAIMKSSARKSIKVSDVFTDGDDGRIFINSQVTPHFSKILAYGRTLIRSESIAACYMTPVGVAIKFNIDANHILVKSIDDIDRQVNESKNKRTKIDKRQRSENDVSPNQVAQKSKSLRKKK